MELEDRSRRRRVLTLASLGPVAVASVVRVAYWVLVTPNYVPRSDDAQYFEIGSNLAHGRGFAMVFPQMALHPTAFRPPLYPGVLGAAFALFGTSIVVGRVLNLVLGVGVVLLVGQVTATMTTQRGGVIAAIAVALYPPLIANDVVLLSEPLALGLLLAMVLALARERVLVAGALCGLLLLTRPSASMFVAVAAAWVVWRLGWKAGARLVVMSGLVAAPWITRNWVELGAPVLVTSNGFNLATRYSGPARESGGFVDPVVDPRFAGYRLAQFDEIGWQREMQSIALASVRAHPSQVLSVVRGNLVSEFELLPSRNMGAEVLDGRNLTFRAWTLPSFYLVTAGGVAGLVAVRRERTGQLLVGLMAVSVMSSLVFVAPPRLRGPFDLICCIGLGVVVERWIARREALRPWWPGGRGSPGTRGTSPGHAPVSTSCRKGP